MPAGAERRRGPEASTEGKGGPHSCFQLWLCLQVWGDYMNLASPVSPAPVPTVSSWLLPVPLLLNQSLAVHSLSRTPPPPSIWGTAGMGQALKTEPNTVIGPSSEAVGETHSREEQTARGTAMEKPQRLTDRNPELRTESGRIKLTKPFSQGTECLAAPHPNP